RSRHRRATRRCGDRGGAVGRAGLERHDGATVDVGLDIGRLDRAERRRKDHLSAAVRRSAGRLDHLRDDLGRTVHPDRRPGRRQRERGSRRRQQRHLLTADRGEREQSARGEREAAMACYIQDSKHLKVMTVHGQVTPVTPAPARDAGYAMAVLLVSLSVAAVLLTAAMPVWKQMATREEEEELVFRGQQYVRPPP